MLVSVRFLEEKVGLILTVYFSAGRCRFRDDFYRGLENGKPGTWGFLVIILGSSVGMFSLCSETSYLVCNLYWSNTIFHTQMRK